MKLTNCKSHLDLTTKQIIELLKGRKNLAFVSRSLKYLEQNIKSKTAFLDELFPENVLNTKSRMNVLIAGITSADDIPLCTVCKTNKVRILKKERTFSSTCSPKCERVLAAQKTQETWGDDGCPLSDPENRKKAIEAAHSTEAKIKRKMTNMERYGVDNPSKSEEVRSRISEKIKKSKVIIIQKFKKNESNKKAKVIKNRPTVPHTTYKVLHKSSTIKINGELSLRRFIEELGFSVVSNDRSVIGKELDILIPEKAVAIEYNGLYWHSKKFIEDPQYHLKKTKMCKEKGIRLIHIFEDEWNNKRAIIKKKLADILGVNKDSSVYARKCEVRRLHNIDVRDFYEEHHIQGHSNASVVYSLVVDGTIVAAMSFKKKNDIEYELTRYATSTKVCGGFSKLLKHFIKIHDSVKVITSFADLRYSNGDVYRNNGFEEVSLTRPDYHYVVNGERVRKQNYRHDRRLKELPNYNPNISEVKNMRNHGYYQIYDCGLIKFELRV